ncbi:MAG: hypothetical protein JNG84_08575, partial [Archangium sp.]|nr:hypothetical protein [Archangium sp.]
LGFLAIATTACLGAEALADTNSSEAALLAADGSADSGVDGCRGGHRQPPPEAFTACANLTEGTACSVTHDSRTIQGTCRAGPQGEALACAPNGPPPSARFGPPQESVDACASLASDAACSFSLDGQTVSGTCRHGPPGRPLACAPAGMGPPPGHRRN